MSCDYVNMKKCYCLFKRALKTQTTKLMSVMLTCR